MRHLVIAASLVAAATAAPPPALAEPSGSFGCTAYFVDDPQSDDPARELVELHAGPLVLADGGTPLAGRVACSVQRDPWWHSTPDDARATSPTTVGVVALPPTLVPVERVPDAWYWVCLEVQVDGGPTYYDTGQGGWSTDPGARCAYAIRPPEDPGPPPHIDYDPSFVCAVLALLLPPEGDVDGVWDCPPYDW